jgi:hypothetical protein
MILESPIVAPAMTWTGLALCPRDRVVTGVFMDPPSRALFELQRVDPLTAGEVLAYTAGRYALPGVLVRVRNRSAEPARFRAQIDSGPDLSRLEHQVGVLVEDAWRRGGDRVTEAEQRATVAATRRRDR